MSSDSTIFSQHPVLADIAAERIRQIAKGYDAAHDDARSPGFLADIAAHIIMADSEILVSGEDRIAIIDHILDRHGTDVRHVFVIAAALLVAEIERMDRIDAHVVEQETTPKPAAVRFRASDFPGRTMTFREQVRAIAVATGRPKILTTLTLDPARYRPTYNSGADESPTIDYATLADDLDRFGWPDDLVSAVRMCAEDFDPFGDEATDDPDSGPLDEQ